MARPTGRPNGRPRLEVRRAFFAIRVEPRLKERVREAARLNRQSLSEFVIEALDEAVADCCEERLLPPREIGRVIQKVEHARH